MLTPLPYRPYPLLRNGHLQTIMVGLLCGERPQYRAESLIIPTHDEESLVAHEEQGPPLGRDANLVILLHGLGGDHRSAYLERLAPRIRAAGFVVWRLDLRSCGAGLDHAWRPANAGSSHDLAAAVNVASAKYPEKPIHIVGFSLSGNILLKMLGELGSGQSSLAAANLVSALAIAPPVNLHDCADNMDRFSRRLYSSFYLKMLDAQVQLRRERWQPWRGLPQEPNLRTIRQFDARYTAPLNGFRDTDEYYTQSSAVGLLKHIQTPTTILADRHDPIVTVKSLEKAELSDSTQLFYSNYGGHMGYFGLDAHGQMIRWLEYYVLHYLKQQVV